MKEARWGFNPCEFHELLYLCGWGSESMEAFDPDSRTFLLLNVTLPENSDCYLFVESEQLVVLSDHFVTRWSLSEGCDLVQLNSIRHKEYWVRSFMAPVVDPAAGVIYICYDGECYSINLNGSGRKVVSA